LTGKSLFREPIQAWALGPVAPDLYAVHGDKHQISRIPGADAPKLTDARRETIDAVLETYGSKSPWPLVHYTQIEPPWRNARKGVPFTRNVGRVIRPKAMRDYYGGLLH
jgi:uncharacterized phage-associated protein